MVQITGESILIILVGEFLVESIFTEYDRNKQPNSDCYHSPPAMGSRKWNSIRRLSLHYEDLPSNSASSTPLRRGGGLGKDEPGIVVDAVRDYSSCICCGNVWVWKRNQPDFTGRWQSQLQITTNAKRRLNKACTMECRFHYISTHLPFPGSFPT